MKQKQLKNLAKQIAQKEKMLETVSGEEANKIQNEIISLCSKVTNVEDMLLLDEEIQKLLS